MKDEKLFLFIECDSFNFLKLEVDIKSISYYGNTDGYDYNDPKSVCSLRFCLAEGVNVNETIDYIKSKFTLNSETTKVEDYLKINLDSTPQITIKFRAGYKGFTNPPGFYFRNAKV